MIDSVTVQATLLVNNMLAYKQTGNTLNEDEYFLYVQCLRTLTHSQKLAEELFKRNLKELKNVDKKRPQ